MTLICSTAAFPPRFDASSMASRLPVTVEMILRISHLCYFSHVSASSLEVVVLMMIERSLTTISTPLKESIASIISMPQGVRKIRNHL